MKDAIREYLKNKGCAEHIVKGGLQGLVEMWETIVTEISHGYDLTFDDYLGDMDTRQLLEEVKPLATTAAHKSLIRKLGRIDAIMRTLVESTQQALPGEHIAQERNWIPARHWWYFSKPKYLGPDLREEMENL